MTIDNDHRSPANARARHTRRWTYAIVAAGPVLALCALREPSWPVVHAVVLAREQASRSVWDGVYTEAQAARGREAYAQDCAICHGDKLEGATAPPLVGSAFTSGLTGKTMGDFFARLSATMPDDNPGRLSRQRYADIIAYLLQANEYPSGSTELTPDADALKQIGFNEKPAVK
jgi:mono/diheme cytochrome c family protein